MHESQFLPRYFFLKSIKRIVNGTVTEPKSLRAIEFATKIVKFSSLQAWDIGVFFCLSSLTQIFHYVPFA